MVAHCCCSCASGAAQAGEGGAALGRGRAAPVAVAVLRSGVGRGARGWCRSRCRGWCRCRSAGVGVGRGAGVGVGRGAGVGVGRGADAGRGIGGDPGSYSVCTMVSHNAWQPYISMCLKQASRASMQVEPPVHSGSPGTQPRFTAAVAVRVAGSRASWQFHPWPRQLPAKGPAGIARAESCPRDLGTLQLAKYANCSSGSLGLRCRSQVPLTRSRSPVIGFLRLAVGVLVPGPGPEAGAGAGVGTGARCRCGCRCRCRGPVPVPVRVSVPVVLLAAATTKSR